MTRIEDKITDIKLQSSVEEDGKFYVLAEALTTDFECETGLNALSKDAIRQAVTYRHRHPIQKEFKTAHIFGRIVEAWVDNSLIIKAEMYDHTQDHRDLIEIIKKRDFVNDPLGWSMHYRTYFNEEGKKYHWDVFEIAGTHIPACKECKTIKFGVNIMEDGNQKNEKELELEKSKKIEEALETIKDLENKLNAKTQSLEDLKSKVQKLESETEAKDKALEEAQESKKTMDERVLEMESKIKYLETKKPVIDKILEANSNIDDEELKWLKSMDIDYLKKRLEREESESETKIHVHELEDTAKKMEELKKMEEEALEKKKDVKFEEFTRALGFDKK